MPDPISLIQLENASRDADDLATILNGSSATTVNLRLGGTVPTISKLIADIIASSDADIAAAIAAEIASLEAAYTLSNSYVERTQWNGLIPASTLLLNSVTTLPYTLPINLTGSSARFTAVATAARVFDIKKVTAAGVTTTIGSVNVALGASVGTFTFAGAISFAQGDLLQIIAPAAQDATLTNASIALLGEKD